MEIRSLREVNERLQRDSQELRDLCCFLDDDRQKGRKLAREWQRFGRYTASVMRQEVAAYQGKLRGLDARQQDLLRDNLQLKELCLYLDQERLQSTCSSCGVPSEDRRDDGDGSSSSTITNQEDTLSPSSPPPPPHPPPMAGGGMPPMRHPAPPGNRGPPPPALRVHQPSSRSAAIEEAIHRHRTIINEQVLRYIRNLERRIELLELEKNGKEMQSGNGERKYQSGIPRAPLYRRAEEANCIGVPRMHAGNGLEHSVLEVHEQLDKTTDSELEFEELAEGEKALVREMCNVASDLEGHN
ncbi:coiled-coil domain-containing protein 85C, putative [Ixodes scapularis]|uniref:Coiled-coil domain-containing protein 85C, putative n=1 Tax=Ixodes scapularis TaxID=6945 RepID=B7QNH7_IXOSC|nr:coiled-coil domain-containing protein 85C, putative [Ixodes scapularis]|eukprot:XP_002416482.1 coiled-coil domain-containing protein 85C, putative [Ixodes scapularis]